MSNVISIHITAGFIIANRRKCNETVIRRATRRLCVDRVRLSGAMRKAKLDGAVAEPDVGFPASRARLKGTWRLEYGGEAKRQGRVDSADKRQ